MTNTDRVDQFAGIRPHVPTGSAPGTTDEQYPGYSDQDRWHPVIYYPVVEVAGDRRRSWLVEPYPADRAVRGALSLANGVGVAVLTGSSAPQRHVDADLPGDVAWRIFPNASSAAESAYEVLVDNPADLLAAWCEAYAIATALNNGLVKALKLKPADIQVLLAAERGALTGDSRFVGTTNELRWQPISQGERDEPDRVGARQARRLRTSLAVIEVADTRKHAPDRAEFSSSGTGWTESIYRLTRAGARMLDEIRRASLS